MPVETITIKDFETDDEIAEIDADGELRTSDEEFKKLMLGLTDGGGAVPRRTADYDEEEEAHITRIIRIAPGEQGYLHTVADCLPSPYKLSYERSEGYPDLEKPPMSRLKRGEGDDSEDEEAEAENEE
jgi:hypothetical protein